MGFIKEFKEFAMKGNVMDMAVGVIIGAAFGKIVSSMVDDILMPLVGMVTGNVDFTNLAFQIGEGEDAAVLKYGNFIQNTVDFIIVAFCIFLMLKGINKLNRKKEEPARDSRLTEGEEVNTPFLLYGASFDKNSPFFFYHIGTT